MPLFNLTCGQILSSKFTLAEDLAGGICAFHSVLQENPFTVI